jgi:glutaredoxin
MSEPSKVSIYSAAWCEACQVLKAFFRKAGIKYKEKDVEAGEGKRVKETGALPLTVVNGVEVKGFDPIQIARLLGIKFDFKKLTENERYHAFGVSARKLHLELRGDKGPTGGSLRDAQTGYTALCTPGGNKGKDGPNKVRVQQLCTQGQKLISEARQAAILRKAPKPTAKK